MKQHSHGDEAERAARALIWAGRSDELLGQPALDPASWTGAVRTDMEHSRALHGMLPQQVPEAEGDPSCCVIMMVKDESDIVGLNLRWLRWIGIRRFVILDNLSTDGTHALIERFRAGSPGCETLILSDPIRRYMQSEKMTGLMRLAASIWPDVDWILPIDADELLIPTNGLSVLKNLDRAYDVVVIEKVNHYLQDDRGSAVDELLVPMRQRSLLGRFPPKIILRANTAMAILQGNHEVRLEGSPRRIAHYGGLSLGFYYREFQVRSFEQFLKKVTNGGQAVLLAERHLGRPIGGDHWKHWYALLQAQGEPALRALFREHCVRSASDTLLNDPCIVERIMTGRTAEAMPV